MTEVDLLEHIFERLCRADSGEEIFGADEAAQWPGGALEVLVKSGLLDRAEPAQVIECDGCERNCFMPVHVRPAEGNRPACAFISCDKPEDVGRVPVELGRLAQWRITGGMLAAALARLLGFTKPPHEDSVGKRWTLGRLEGEEYKGEVKLSIEGGVALMVAGQNIPLVHVLTLTRRGLKADKDALLRLVDGDTRQPPAGVGSVAWRKQTAKAAANARHNQPGQRFQLLVYPDPRRWEWRDRAPDKAARERAFAVFEALAEFDPVAWGAAPADDFADFPHFRFSDEAQAVFIEWSEDMHRGRMPNEDEPIIRQHLAKFDKLFPALALVFHLVDCAAQGIGGPVTKEAALRAAAWCEYLEAHARRCYGLLKDDGLRAAQALAVKLERGALEDGFTLRDVRRNQWRSLTTDDAIQAALDWLEDEDWLRSEATGGTGPGSGRRTLRYRIHPAIKGKRKGGDA